MQDPNQLLIVADSNNHDIAPTEPLVLLNGIDIGEDRQVLWAQMMAQIFVLPKRIKYFLKLLKIKSNLDFL